MRERLDGLGLVCFCKTTGGKGLHVITALAASKKSKLTWPDAKAFAFEWRKRIRSLIGWDCGCAIVATALRNGSAPWPVAATVYDGSNCQTLAATG